MKTNMSWCKVNNFSIKGSQILHDFLYVGFDDARDNPKTTFGKSSIGNLLWPMRFSNNHVLTSSSYWIAQRD